MLTLALGLAASLVWGTADFLGGLSARQRSLWAVVVVAQLGGLGLAGVVWLAAAGDVPSTTGLLAAAGGGAAGAVAIAAFYRALAVGTMGVVAPIAATGVVVPVIVGVVGGERPSAVQLGGAVLATAGVVLASRAQGIGGGAAHRSAIALAVLAALGFGFVFVGLERAGDEDAFWAILVARAAATTLVLAAALTLRARLELPRDPRGLGLLALVGVLDTGANVLFVLAADQGLLSVTAVLGSLYPAVTIVLARVVLRERLSTVQAGGVVLTLAGVVAIAVG